MKIKRLIEEKKLIEANDEIDLAEIDPQADSTQDIAAAVQDEIEELSDGEVEISPKEAEEVAKITKDVALAVNAGQVTFAIEDADFEDAKIENRLTRALDKAYETAKTSMSDNSKNGANILVEGLPGSGKTAIVESWCESHGLTLVSMNATDPKIETAINGMPLRDITKNDENAVAYSYAMDQFEPLLNDKHPELAGKCVLFVDELNRQKTAQLRRPFMSLFNEKRNASGSLDFRKNLLFSVVCINPFGPQFHDQGVSELNPAEKNRFLIKRKNYDSNTDDAKNYWNGWAKNALLKLGIISPGSTASKNHNDFVGPTRDLSSSELDRAQRIIKMYTLAMHILNHPEFSFSTRDDAEDIYNEDADYVTSRMLTDGINHSKGNVKEFLEWVEEDSNFTQEAISMFRDILNGYIMDTKALYARYNLIATNSAQGTPVETSNPAEVEEEDEELWTTSGTNSTSIKSPAATEQEINDILNSKDWF